MLEPQRRLALTDVLSTTGSVLAGNFPAFFATALLFTAPALAVDAWLAHWRIDAAHAVTEQPFRYDPYGYDYDPYPMYVSEDELMRVSALALLATGLVSAFCIAATQAGVLYTVVEHLAGRRAGLGSALAKGIGRLPAAFGAMVLASCVVLFGSTCLVVPAVIAAALFYFAVPAAVIEELSPFRAVARSVDLTQGNRALLLGLVGALMAFFAAARFGLRALWGAPPLLATELAQVPAEAPSWSYFVALGLVGVFEAMLLAVLSSVMYARLRERDGFDVEKRAEVFA